jgi:hypothetical protein
MYGNAYGWQRQNWQDDPRPFGVQNRPADYQPNMFQKRQQHPLTAGAGNGTEADHHEAVCHVDQPAQQHGSVGGNPDLDGLQFVDMDSNPVDGRRCDVIYDDNDPGSRMRIVMDEDGGMAGMYVEHDADVEGWGVDSVMYESPVTLVISATTIPASARPGGGEASLTVPVRTTSTRKRVKTVVTYAPVV